MATHTPRPRLSHRTFRPGLLGVGVLFFVAAQACSAGLLRPSEQTQGAGTATNTSGSQAGGPTNANASGGGNVVVQNGNANPGGGNTTVPATDPNATPGQGGTAAMPGWVQRQGAQLMVDGKVFRFAGPNIYWMAGSDPQKVREGLATAKAMGATVVRANSLGTYLGKPGTLEPSLGVFDPNGFATIDYAIAMAAKYGLRLQIPFTDNYDYDGQGKYVFLRWRGLTDGNLFYTDPNLIADFKAYIKNFICHVNTLTGVRYRDDPTIAIWETGNEFGAYMFREGVPPVSFTKTIADHIKSLDPNHLVMDGSDGIVKEALNLASVDVYSNHYYPPDLALYKSDEAAVTGAGKALVIGEWDWTGAKGGADLASFLTTLENGKAAGDMWWSLFVHDAACKSFEPHDDGYTLHYPGDNDDMASRAELLRQHAYKMSGVAVPAKTAVPCPTPNP